jgi:hypothetical protein
MLYVLLLLCLTCAAVCSSFTPPTPDYAQPQRTVALKSKQGKEVHSVVVDMPQVESLEFASPDTWYRLRTASVFPTR